MQLHSIVFSHTFHTVSKYISAQYDQLHAHLVTAWVTFHYNNDIIASISSSESVNFSRPILGTIINSNVFHVCRFFHCITSLTAQHRNTELVLQEVKGLTKKVYILNLYSYDLLQIHCLWSHSYNSIILASGRQ